MKRVFNLLVIGCLTLALLIGVAGAAGKSAAASQISHQEPSYPCSIKVPEPEPTDLSSLAKINADQAISAAQAAFPGAAVKKVELGNENGCLVYDVALSNGLEVKVDAGNGAVLHKAPANSEDDDEDDEGNGK